MWEWVEVADPEPYGAAVAKSVAPEPWPGRQAPRLAPLPTGMLNGIGIQNPGIAAWVADMETRIPGLGVPVWGSAVGGEPGDFSAVAKSMSRAGVEAVEVNLSCPNLDDGEMFSLDAGRSAEVIASVRSAVDLPLGAKLSPDTPDIVGVAAACHEAGADFVVLTNTARGFGLSPEDGSHLLSGGIGGYSGPGLKPISLRCVYEVARALPEVQIVGCGGVTTGRDVVEYLRAGATAVAMGTVHFSEPSAGKRILRELMAIMTRLGAGAVQDLVAR